jgi:hypothetical protein
MVRTRVHGKLGQVRGEEIGRDVFEVDKSDGYRWKRKGGLREFGGNRRGKGVCIRREGGRTRG